MRILRMFQQALILWRAGRNIAAGQEIRISYGPLSDGELLLIYGFVEGLEAPAVNPNNKVVLAESDVCDAAKVCSRTRRARLAFIRNMRVIIWTERESFPVTGSACLHAMLKCYAEWCHSRSRWQVHMCTAQNSQECGQTHAML